ncbi:hypothetical protein K3A88_19255, partial [Streptomyces geysiriensis]|nr:hypothetical protein [Streptomyces geysiriensis]
EAVLSRPADAECPDLRVWPAADVLAIFRFLEIPLRYRAPSVIAVGGKLVVGLSGGLLAVSVSPSAVTKASSVASCEFR